ncbi:MAG: 5-carboxymethyl-2-hydroxymuconate isomerase [Burkholderiales bacterium]|jgi:5-carboxymethyl-2-hydroxymuconate isomerase|nr:5-carboxymethyl-2-hydroxymuconate isomerase [Burkholderiales bacterium]
MPHVVLRHSNNLSNCDFVPLFKKLHELMVNSLGVKLTSCSSMVIPHTQYLIGDGDSNNAFIHLEIKVKPYIGKKSLDQTGERSLEMLKDYMVGYDMFKIKMSVDCLVVSEHFKS